MSAYRRPLVWAGVGLAWQGLIDVWCWWTEQFGPTQVVATAIFAGLLWWVARRARQYTRTHPDTYTSVMTSEPLPGDQQLPDTDTEPTPAPEPVPDEGTPDEQNERWALGDPSSDEATGGEHTGPGRE